MAVNSGLSVEASTLSPLPPALTKGLPAVAFTGTLSFVSSTALFIYLLVKIARWRFKNGFEKPLNQFLVLIMHLLFADIQQGIAFMLNIKSLQHNMVEVGTATCWAQAWFLSTGDLASSVMITAIGVHTFLSIVNGYRPPTWIFHTALGCCWVFVYLLAIIGPLKYGNDFFVRASLWCWINTKYQIERLWLHYFWMFCFMGIIVLNYTFIIVYLRTARFRTMSQHLSPQLIESATPTLLIYPFIYVICTCPLAIGRLYTMSGGNLDFTYFCVAGSMIASNGWLDVLLYATTRREIVFGEELDHQDTGLETFAFYGKGQRFGTTTTIEANSNSNRPKRHERNTSNRVRLSDSVENLYSMGDIQVKGEVTVKVEDGRNELHRRDRITSSESISGNSRDDGNGWDTRSVKSAKSILMNRV